MGGECFQEKPAKTLRLQIISLNVKEYQELLLQLKTQCETEFNDGHVQWCDTNALPPADNVFASFNFPCGIHKYSKHPELPCFSLYWNPLMEKYDYGNEHDWLENTDELNRFNEDALFYLQRRIVEKFPDYFSLYCEINDSTSYCSEQIGEKYIYKSINPWCSNDKCSYCGYFTD